jgi:hypothetical protein
MTNARRQEEFWTKVEKALTRYAGKRYLGRPVGRSQVSPFSIRHPLLGALKVCATATLIVGGLLVVGLLLEGRHLNYGTLWLVLPIPAVTFILALSYYHFLHRYGTTEDGQATGS